MVDAAPRPDLRSRWLPLAGIALAAPVVGWLLGVWVPGTSERFYLLVPPIAAAVYLIWNRPPREDLKKLLLKTFGRLLLAGAGCYAFMTAMLYQMMPTKGPGFVEYVNGWEVLTALYFLVAIVLIAAGIGSLFDRLGRAIAARVAPPNTEGVRPRKGLAFALEQILPRVLTVLVVLPYLLATLTVHRMRIPVMTTPMTFDKRDFDEVSFQASDGTTLRGWFIPAREPSNQTVIVCHGLGANRGIFLQFLHVANVLDSNILFFDFRGHGSSDGHTISLGYWEKLDVLAAIDYLRRERSKESQRLIGLGISMGSASMIRAAAEVEPPLDGLIIDSGFTSTADMAEQVVWFLPPATRGPFVALGVPIANLETGCQLLDVRPIDDIDRVRAPIQFFHAEGDSLIPLAQGQRLFEKAKHPKWMFVAKVPHHGGALSGEPHAYFQEVVEHMGRKKTVADVPAAIPP